MPSAPCRPAAAHARARAAPQQPPPPTPRPAGTARRVAAASLNYPDALQVQGSYQDKPALPFLVGNEAAGTVIEVGASVRGLRPGDAVCAVGAGGAFADEWVAHQGSTWRVPGGARGEGERGVGWGAQHWRRGSGWCGVWGRPPRRHRRAARQVGRPGTAAAARRAVQRQGRACVASLSRPPSL